MSAVEHKAGNQRQSEIVAHLKSGGVVRVDGWTPEPVRKVLTELHKAGLVTDEECGSDEAQYTYFLIRWNDQEPQP